MQEMTVPHPFTISIICEPRIGSPEWQEWVRLNRESFALLDAFYVEPTVEMLSLLKANHEAIRACASAQGLPVFGWHEPKHWAKLMADYADEMRKVEEPKEPVKSPRPSAKENAPQQIEIWGAA